jgi:maltooligosyltrehalose trehalohydrolase
MFFQGQELGSRQPFVYFCDHEDSLAKLVRQGRAQEMSVFRSTTHPDLAPYAPDVASKEAFLNSKLKSEAGYQEKPIFRLFQDLLKLRREDVIFRSQRADRIHGAVLGPLAFAIRFFGEGGDSRLLLLNLGRDLYPMPGAEPLLAPPPGMDWTALWFSEHPRYEGFAIPPLEEGYQWRLAGNSALVLAPKPAVPRADEPSMGSTRLQDVDIHPAIREGSEKR